MLNVKSCPVQTKESDFPALGSEPSREPANTPCEDPESDQNVDQSNLPLPNKTEKQQTQETATTPDTKNENPTLPKALTDSKTPNTTPEDLGWISKSQDLSPNMTQDDYSEGWVGPENFGTWQATQQFSASSTKESDKAFTLEMESRLVEWGVGLVSGDFAVQNIALQMGIPLLSTSGQIVSRLKSYVMECFSCNSLETDCAKRFCKSCGKDTMSRVTCEFGPNNEITLFKRKNYRFHKRGLRFDIPDPKGGRKINELLLTEDCFARPKVQAFLKKKRYHERQARKGIEENWDVGGIGFEEAGKSNKNFFELKVGYGRKNPNVNSFWKKKAGVKKKNRKRGKKRN